MISLATFNEVITALEALGIMPTTMPQLGPMERALRAAGLFDRIPPHSGIIIAGTNGKGTTAATLSALLTATGRRVGLYTSPHLVSSTERYRINDSDISKEVFVAAYNAMAPFIAQEGLTHFEALTLMAAHIFYSGQCGPPVDFAIWEVGLGGRFDATNAIPHDLCAITALGLDHQNILGATLPEIAVQKCGVIGRGATVVYSPMDPALAPLRAVVAAETGCRWIEALPMELTTPHRLSTPWGEVPVALAGRRAAENTAVALTLCHALGFASERYLRALAQVRWPGRFSRHAMPGFPCPLYLSGDHNIQGVESLLQILSSMTWKTLHLVVGIGQDKNASRMLALLSTLPRVRLYLTETPFRPLALVDYPPEARAQAVASDPNVFKLFELVAQDATTDDLAVVTGSLYLVGKILTPP